MARNRLTWQNVNAPDYGSAMRGAEAANRMFQDALGGLNTSLGSFKDAQNEALLKQQQAAEAGYLRQMAAVSGDTEQETALRRGLSGNTLVSNDFLGKQLTDFRNAQLTGNTTAENLAQTVLDNQRTNRDNQFVDQFRPTAGNVAAYVSGGGGDPFSQMSPEQRMQFNMLPAEEQTRLLSAWSGEQTSNLGRDNTRLGMNQTRQNMYQSGVRFGDEQSDRANKQMADAAIVYALSSATDEAGQRRAIVDFATSQGASPTAALDAFNRHIGASNSAAGRGSSGSGSVQTGEATPRSGAGVETVLGNSPDSEVERLLGEFQTRSAQNQFPVSDEMLRAGERNRPLATHYEEAVKNFPNTIGQISINDYNKIATDIKRENSNLTNDQVAVAIQERFEMGPSNWESLDDLPLPLRIPTILPGIIGNAFLPNWGREAGINEEGLRETAEIVGTPEARNQAVTQQQAVANAGRLLQEQQQRVAQAREQAQQAQIHYQQWRNPSVLSDAERDLQLEQDNLDSLLNDFRTDEHLSEVLSPLFRDPENPGRTISVQQGRARNRAASIANDETAYNRREALEAIPYNEASLESLEAEYRNTPISSPRRQEIMKEVQRLRKVLREQRKLAR